MKTKKQITEKLENIKRYVNSVEKHHLLTERERIAYLGSCGAVNALEWVIANNEEDIKHEF